MTRATVFPLAFLAHLLAAAQGGDQQVRAKADALFGEQRFADALPLYTQLVSLSPGDRTLNYHLGTCLLHSAEDREKAVGHLKFASEDPAVTLAVWYWLGRAYHLNYRFKDALGAYQRYRGTASPKLLAELPVEALEQQCRNGLKLMGQIKEIAVRNKVEAEASEFFRFYDLTDIGGRILVVPDELRSPLDKKRGHRALLFRPDAPGPVYFSSYGKEGKTGLDIYRAELMPDGRFSSPVKLSGYINTDFDEDFPFMHPDGKTFYFSSKGHSSMGGYDVFRARYDRGMDTFGRPENLDFAVSTPADDIFYITDAEHKEACFASGRQSRQGRLHVYRVGTTAVPVVITVLKGTFASEFDKDDRKARIVVEDVLTQERVADVRTDINGDYVLALPRSGRYRFLVDCGPTGKTHAGTVEVPRADGPRAYRQELSLTRQGDLERLVIRNYFDQPLDEDLIALSLEEIKRRARLDVSDKPLPAPPPEPETPSGDLLTRAGFSGDLDEAAVVKLAQEDTRRLEQQAAAYAAQAKAAFELALAESERAERGARTAAEQVERALKADTEAERNALMADAARARQHAAESNLRARAAQRTAVELDAERDAAATRATQAAQRATEVQRTLTAKRDQEALAALVDLKKALDERSAPTAVLDPAEKARRTATEIGREADRAVQRAQNLRLDENELVDRINRLKREQEESRSKPRREQLAQEIGQYETQLAYLREEARQAFATARTKEEDAAAARGQAALARTLAEQGNTLPAGKPDMATLATLGQRIAATRERLAGIAVDERYDSDVALGNTEREARTFDWSTLLAGGAIAEDRSATRATDRDGAQAARMDQRTTGTRTDGDPTAAAPGGTRTTGQVDPSSERAERTDTRGVDPANPDLAQRQPAAGTRTTTAGQVDPSSERAERTDTRGVDPANPDLAQRQPAVGTRTTTAGQVDPSSERAERTDTRGVDPANPDLAQRQPAAGTRTTTAGQVDPSSERAERTDTRGVDPANPDLAQRQPAVGTRTTTAGQVDPSSERAERTDTRGVDPANPDLAQRQPAAGTRTTTAGQVDPSGEGATDSDARTTDADRDARVASDPRPTDAGARTGQPGGDGDDRVATAQRGAVPVRRAADEANAGVFLKENELAELRQLRDAERNRTKRTELEQRIAALEAELAAERAVVDTRGTVDAQDDITPLLGDEGNDAARVPIVFTPDTRDARIIAQLFAGYEADKRNLERLPDADERAASLHGLELMLADSLRAEMARQVAVLDLAPQQANVVLPRVERLRKLREEHLALAETHLQVRQREVLLAAQEGAAGRSDPAPQGALRTDGGREVQPTVPFTTVRPAGGEGRDAIEERYVAIVPTARGVYHSAVEHRAKGREVNDAIAFRNADLARIDRLQNTIDSLRREAEDQPRRAYDQLMKQADRAYDDLLIVRTDLGQRSAFLTREEWRTGLDSLKRMEKLVGARGLPPTEPLLVMAKGFRATAQAELDRATQLRKRADRIEDILQRDSLYREAYATELAALRDLDKSITVYNHLSGTGHVRGEQLSYPEVAARVLGISPDPPLLADVPDADAADRRAGSDPQAGTRSDAGAAREGQAVEALPADRGRDDLADAPRTTAANAPGADAGAGRRTDATQGTEAPRGTAAADRDPAPGTAVRGTDRPAAVDAAPSAQQGSRPAATAAPDTRAADMPGGDVAARAAASEAEARSAAAAIIARVEARMPATAVTPASAYERYLDAEQALRPEVRTSATSRSAQLAQEAAERASDARSKGEEADEAQARAATAKGRERRELEALSTRLRLEAEQLDTEAALRSAQAAEAVRLERDAEQREALRQRLRKYYYMDNDEMDLVLDDPDRSRFFTARSLALVQLDAASDARAGAEGSRALATALTTEAVRVPAAQAEPLRLRAAGLIARADSLDNVADRLAGAAAVNEAQAAVLLQGMDAAAATDLMALEMAQRRTEARLGEARGTAGPPVPAQRTDPVAVAPARTAPPATAPQPAPASPSAAPASRAALQADVFAVSDAPQRRTGAIPIDAPMPAGVVFKVQIGAFRSAPPDDAFGDLSPVTGERLENGLTRYSAGLFTGFEGANAARDLVRERGYRDAFVVAYRDGVRIPLSEALRGQAGEAVAMDRRAPVVAPAETRPATRPAAVPATETAPLPVATTPAEAPAARIERPVTTPSVPMASEDPAEVLASYPATAGEILSTFAPPPGAAAYYNVPGAAPARQVETVRGLFFTVQVGVYSRPVPLDKLFNITPLNSERVDGGKIRYTTGVFLDLDSVQRRRDEAITLGVKDAFVTAYLNGRRIPMREARALLLKFGPEILAAP